MIYDHAFYCTNCGQNVGYKIPRKENKLHESGHLKKLYCLNCREEHNAVEIVPYSKKYTYEKFKKEFDAGVFVNV